MPPAVSAAVSAAVAAAIADIRRGRASGKSRLDDLIGCVRTSFIYAVIPLLLRQWLPMRQGTRNALLHLRNTQSNAFAIASDD
jgi:hypothetical protein